MFKKWIAFILVLLFAVTLPVCAEEGEETIITTISGTEFLNNQIATLEDPDAAFRALLTAIYVASVCQHAEENAKLYGMEDEYDWPSGKEFLAYFDALGVDYEVVETEEGYRVYLCKEVYMLITEENTSAKICIEGFESDGVNWEITIHY